MDQISAGSKKLIAGRYLYFATLRYNTYYRKIGAPLQLHTVY
jgi:hypothetical protein